MKLLALQYNHMSGDKILLIVGHAREAYLKLFS